MRISFEAIVPEKKFLFIYSHIPNSSARTAGQVTAWRNLNQLMNRGRVDIFLAVNSADLDQLPTPWSGNIGEIAVVPINPIYKLLAVAFHSLKYSPRFSTRLTLQAKRTFKALVKDKLYEEIWIECTEGAVFLDLLHHKSQTTIYAQDVLVQASLRSIGINRYFSSGIFRDEKRFLSKVDRIIVPSGKDAALIESLYSISNVSVALPALSQFISKISRVAGGSTPYSILFWGAMSRPENYLAIIKFLDFGWEKISQQFPASVLYIVGSNPPAQLLKRASARVIVTGYIDDPSSFFEKASIGIVPLEQGAGVKVKVLEMLEAGIPIISTPVGAEGVENNSLLRVVDFDEISDAVISFFKDMNRGI